MGYSLFKLKQFSNILSSLNMKRTAEYNWHESNSDKDDYSEMVGKRYAGAAVNKSVFKDTFTNTWQLHL